MASLAAASKSEASFGRLIGQKLDRIVDVEFGVVGHHAEVAAFEDDGLYCIL